MTTERGWHASWHTQRRWSRLWAAVRELPWWQRLAAVAVSLWWLLWVTDRFGPRAANRTPLGVLHWLVAWAGFRPPTELDVVIDWLHDPRHHGFLAVAAWVAGVCWAAASERTIVPSVLGWTVVLTASEGLGYDAAAARAGGGFALLVAVLLLLSLPLRRATVIRRARLLPMDVLLGAGKAAGLCVLVVGFAVIRAVSLICAPYLTVPPRLDTRRPVLAAQPDPAQSDPAQPDPAQSAGSPDIPAPAAPMDDTPTGAASRRPPD